MCLIKKLPLLALSVVAFLQPGCSDKTPFVAVVEERDHVIVASDNLLKVNDSTKVFVKSLADEQLNLRYEWSSNMGIIKASGGEATYIAPSTKGDAIMNVRIMRGARVFIEDSISILIYKQLILLKADDFVFNSAYIIPLGWVKFINYIEDKNIKASIGIIGSSFEKGNSAYFDLVRILHHSQHFEMWSHGYNHLLNGIDQNGNAYKEFWNSPYEHQKEHLLKTQQLAQDKSGITLRTFGAPGNAIDENTLKAIEEIDDLKVWYFGLPSYSKLVIRRLAEIEFPLGNPDFSRFLDNYDAERDYLALQIHPKAWDDQQFDQFKKIIEHLIKADVTFINPYEYFSLMNPE